jgi:AcrR family transcriptional regulator
MQDKNTRRLILESLYEDMQVNGFQGLRADKVIKKLGITKGALYHYFPDKFSIGYAIVDEIIGPTFIGYWLPLKAYKGNPLVFMEKSIQSIQKQFSEKNVVVGSPLSNLIHEMSPLDEGFRIRLQAIVNQIHQIIEQALARGQQEGIVSPQLKPAELAWFILSGFEGSYSISKVAKSTELFVENLNTLKQYLGTMKI